MNLSSLDMKCLYINIPYGMWVWDYILCSQHPMDELDVILKAYEESHCDLCYKYWDIYWINREEQMNENTLGVYAFVIENIELPNWMTSIKSFMYQWIRFSNWIKDKYE